MMMKSIVRKQNQPESRTRPPGPGIVLSGNLAADVDGGGALFSLKRLLVVILFLRNEGVVAQRLVSGVPRTVGNW